MAGVDEQGAADAEVARAVFGDEAGIERHQEVEVVVGQVEIAAVVGVDEGDVRIGWAVVLGDDFPHTVGVGEERCCSLVDVEVLLARCGALRSGSAYGRAQYSRDG